MARISKATIKAGRESGGRSRSCLIWGTIFVILVALFSNLVNDGSVTLEDAERSVSDSKSGGGVTTSDTVAHPISGSSHSNNDNNAADASGNIIINENDSNNDPFYPTGVDAKELQYIFHHTPGDRAGKAAHVVLDMMMGHAYAFRERKLYGGSCGSGNDVGRDPERALLKAI